MQAMARCSTAKYHIRSSALGWASISSASLILPSVTGLELDNKWLAREHYPTDLQILDVIHWYYWSVETEFFSFARNNCKSLTSLSLAIRLDAQRVESLELPSLVCLRFLSSSPWRLFEPLLRRVASQLRKLSFECSVSDVQIDPGLRFPQLDRLTIRAPIGVLVHFLTHAHAPLRDQLDITISDRNLSQLAKHAAKVTALALMSVAPAQRHSQIVGFVSDCTRLTRLELLERRGWPREAEEEIIAPHLSRLRHLSAHTYTSHRLAHVLRTATNLTSLELNGFITTPPRACAHTSLRKLRYLHEGPEANSPTMELELIVTAVSRALPLFPKLDALELEADAAHEFGEAETPQLRELLAQAERLGLSTVTLKLDDCISSNAQKKLSREFTWLRVELD